MKREVDIVLPCFNPMKDWYTELLDFDQTAGNNYILNYIIVNDGSTQILNLEELKKVLPPSTIFWSYPTNMGKGHALRKGMELSKSEFAVYTDIDFPFTNSGIISVIDALVSGNQDVVVGYRPEAYYENKMSWFRRFLSKSFRLFVKKILKMPVSDTQCGLKGFNSKGKLKFLETKINRYLFDFEFIYKASKDTSIRILPVAVQLKENVIFSKMKLKIIFQELFNLGRILIFS